MRATTTRGTISYSHDAEDIGQRLDFDIEYIAYPGDPGVYRTRNGDGWPPSPAECEILSARCMRIIDETTDRKPEQREAEDVGKWFVEQINGSDELREEIEEKCFEAAGESCIDDRW